MITTPLHPAFTEHADQIGRISRLRAALEPATRDTARLQRELAQARAENRRLRERLQPQPHPADRARAERRRMLSDSCSRNP